MEYVKLGYAFGVLPVLKTLIVLFPFIACGFVIHFLKERVDSVLINDFGKAPYYVFAILGTPVHELSHILASLIFLHKVRRFSLFYPEKDGQLGYVEHAYDPSSLYQRTGCFFIGLAPVIMGCAVFFVLTQVFFPGFKFQKEIHVSFKTISEINDPSSIASFLSGLYSYFKVFALEFAGRIAEGSWKPAVYLVLVTGVGSHMFPSRSDFSGMLPGLVVLYSVIVIGNGILHLLNIDREHIVSLCVSWTALWVNILLLIIFVLSVITAILYIIALPKRAIFR